MRDLKELFLLDSKIAFLNHGSFGATPAPVFEVYQQWQRRLEFEPVEFLGRRHNDLMRTARQAVAAFVGAAAPDLVFTQNATQALNIVARSLHLGPGDEVLTSDHEYGACDRMWRFLSRRRGFDYIRRPIRLPPISRDQLVQDFMAGVTGHTRAIFLSHVTSPTALLFPVQEICRQARDLGILTIIDGAHAPGQLPLDLAVIGADFYAANLHKWLCAPKGAGFLHARPAVQHLLEPLIVSWGYEAESPGDSTFIDHHEWWGTRDPAAFLTVPSAIEFQKGHDWGSVQLECHRLLSASLSRLSELTGQPSLYPDDTWYLQMAAAPLPTDVSVAELQRRLFDEAAVEVPVLAWNDRKLIRVSIQAYNHESDIDRLLSALQRLI
ncbi:MAG TPA: aminotransferase class V-fold PLP-dependent enzyme [Anaerolineales bacterium]|nr:aminotransferase class V-fold PLP-dependent enzyme [Anaerolineales bacterium]